MSINDDLHKLAMAGLGAASLASEKAQEAVEELAKRGEEALEQGKVLNERLRHDIKSAAHDGATAAETKLDKNTVLGALDHLTPEELAAVREKLDQLASHQQGE